MFGHFVPVVNYGSFYCKKEHVTYFNFVLREAYLRNGTSQPLWGAMLQLRCHGLVVEHYLYCVEKHLCYNVEYQLVTKSAYISLTSIHISCQATTEIGRDNNELGK